MEVNVMKRNKWMAGFAAVILSAGLLGCGANQDEQEPDPSEEPAEQQQEDMNGNAN